MDDLDNVSERIATTQAAIDRMNVQAEALISALKDERKTGGRLLEALRHEDEGADDQLAG